MRIHLEEDAGKNIHAENASLVDFNRSGVPLMEIVSEPDIRSPEEAVDYLRELRGILVAVGASDGKMEEGSLRCDVNVSVRPRGATELGARTDFRYVEGRSHFDLYTVGDDRSGLYKAIAWEMYALARPGAKLARYTRSR